MKILIRLIALTLIIAGVPTGVWAQNVVIRLGTVAPEGSVWYNVLAKMKQDMEKASNGSVIIRISPNGRQGDESEMVRSVRQGTTLNAVALSGAGLAQVDPSINALHIPMLIDSYAQLDYVRKQLEPKLERAIEAKGFVVLNWSDVGWVQFFTKKPARTPDDIRKLRLFTSTGDPDTEQIYKELGFRPVPTGANELLTALQTDRIEAFDVPPILALVNQTFGLAKNMIDMKWSPLVGATVISRKTWETIPEKLRGELLQIARKSGEDLRAQIRSGGDDAIKQMVARGLTVITLTDAEKALWRKEAEGAYPKMKGKLVPPDLFDEAVRLAREYRPGQNVVIRLGTVAPEGSVWYNVLAKMKQDMEKVSNGSVTITISPNGRQGDESEMVRSVRQGTTLNAVALSGAGLAQVDPSISALHIPMLIDTYAQLDFVRRQLEPKLERAIEAKGFVVLNWSDVGWVQFFSKKPARTPDDIRKLRLFTSTGDPDTEQVYKDLGFRPVPTGANEMLSALQTDRIEAFDVPPILALVNQTFGLAKNMIDMKWSPLVGATVISRKTWETIPEKLRGELLQIARKSGEDLRAQIRSGGDDAVKQMVARGLTVVTLTDAEKALWRKEAEGAYPKIKGKLVPPDLFDEAIRLAKEYRPAR